MKMNIEGSKKKTDRRFDGHAHSYNSNRKDNRRIV